MKIIQIIRKFINVELLGRRLQITSLDGSVKYIKPYPGAGMPPSFIKCRKCGNSYYSPIGFCYDCEIEK